LNRYRLIHIVFTLFLLLHYIIYHLKNALKVRKGT